MTSHKSVIYGPVPSRRFGLSLGVDIISHKFCSYDCIYCQLGPTTIHTIQRQRFLSPDRIFKELETALTSGPYPDVVTLAGSGEPTLHTDLDSIIRGINDIADIPIVLITNGSLLHLEEIRSEIAGADILAPSLDAGDEETFRTINKPCSGIEFNEMVDGLRRAVEQFHGMVRLETMLVWGLNTRYSQLEDLARLIRSIDAHHIDINTPVRPNPQRKLTLCPPGLLEDFANRIGPKAQIIASYPTEEDVVQRFEESDLGERIIRMISRRPCSLDDIGAVTGAPRNHILKLLAAFEAEGRVEERSGTEEIYFFSPP